MNTANLWAGRVGTIFVPAALILTWWHLSADSTSLFFPPLAEMVTAFETNWLSADTFFKLAWPSLVRAGAGMAIAMVVGVGVGTLVGLLRTVEAVAKPQLEFMRALPPILIIPPMILVLGTGDGMKVGVIAASAVWPILLAATDGVRAVEPIRADMVAVFRLPWHARLRHLVLPSAVPHIWGGVRASVPIALVVMVASEYYSSHNGIGYFISQTSTSFRLSDMWSAVLLLGLIGMTVNGVVTGIGHLLDRKFGEFDVD